MRRLSCGACGSSRLDDFLDLRDSPLADRFPATPNEPEVRYPLGLTICRHCWLVQNTEIVDSTELYGADYGFYTGASPSSIRYFADYARWVRRAFSQQAAGLIVEIASNDGTLLRCFEELDCRVLGVEPASTVAAVAQDSGFNVVQKLFSGEVAAEIVSEHGKASIIIANNVMAHVPDLRDFTEGIARLLADDGVAIIEVQYLGDLIAGNQFDHVYHEHHSFFSITSLESVLKTAGLYLHDVKFMPTQGGSIRVVAGKLTSSRKKEDFTGAEYWLKSMDVYASMQGRVDYICRRLRRLVNDELNAGRVVAGYGASAKSATLLNYCGFDAGQLAHVADKTPSKYGRYTPGTKIPIISQDDSNADTYLLLTWNYLSGVMRRERKFLDDGGRFIVPIPSPVIL